MGDYNKVLNVADRKYGNIAIGCMEEFAKWVEEMNLINLPLNGQKYTWRRMNSCNRINRVFVHPKWNFKYPTLNLRGLRCSRSDYIPLLVESGQENWALSHLDCSTLSSAIQDFKKWLKVNGGVCAMLTWIRSKVSQGFS